MNLNAAKIVFIAKIIDLKAEVSAKKVMVALVFKINGGGIYIAIALINQDTTMLFQIVVLMSEIQYFGTVVFLLVFCFTDVVTKKQYPWIFYHKLWQYC